MKRIFGIAVATVFALAGCGGDATPAGEEAAPNVPAAASPPRIPQARPAARTDVPTAFRVRVHGAHGHLASYAIVVTLERADGQRVTGSNAQRITDVRSRGGAICAGGCDAAAPPAPTGRDVFSVAVYDTAQRRGACPCAGTVVAATTARLDIGASDRRIHPMEVYPVPASVTLATPFPQGTPGDPITQPFGVTAYDSGGEPIVGTYGAPVTVRDSDTGGGTSISVNGGAAGTKITSTSSTDTFAIVYNGAMERSPLVVAWPPHGVAAKQKFNIFSAAPATTCTDPDGGTDDVCFPKLALLDVNLYAYSGAGSTAYVTAWQTGFSGIPFLHDVTEQNDGCRQLGVSVTQTGSTSPGGGGTVFTLQSGESSVPGLCVMTLTGGSPNFARVNVTFTGSAFGVNGRQRHARSQNGGRP